MLRFSLLTLLGVVLFAAVASAALANPTDTWRQVIVSGAVVALAIATLAVAAKRPAMPFALGFTVIGWLYAFLVFAGAFSLRDHLLTERIAGSLFRLIHTSDGASPQPVSPLYGGYGSSSYLPQPYPPATFGPVTPAPVLDPYAPNATVPPSLGPATPTIDPYSFTIIARSIWMLILATVGGLFASWLGRRRDRARVPSAE